MFLGRRRVREFFRKHFGTDQVNGQEPPSPSPPSSPTPPARRPPLTHAPSSTNTARPGTPRSHHPPSGVTVADRPVGNPRPERSGRRRRRRRTQSPVGLPLYSQEPGEEEMSLFKSQDMFESQLDLSLSLSRATTVERSYEDGEGYESEQEEEEDEIFERGGETRGRPSMEGAARLGGVSQSSSVQGHGQDSSGAGLLQPPSVLSQGRPRSASEPLGPPRLYTTSPNTRVSLSPYMSHTPSSGSSSPFASRSGLIDIPLRPPSPPQTPPLPSPLATRSPGRPTYFTTHRSSRSSPINTLTPPSPASSIRNAGRPRASTLQRLLSGGVNGSTSSLASGGSPYAEGAMGRTASASTVSIRTQEISAPLPGSFVHSSFIFPRSGPTPQQVAFISSRESLGAYGYGNGVAPPHHPLSPTLPEAPPAFGLDEGGRRSGGLEPGTGEGGVRGRGRSGSEASRISGRSPLAVEVREGEGQSPPRSPREVGQLDERASGARGEAVTAGAAHVPPELVSPPSPKPPSSASPAVDLSSTRSSRPHPPDIVTLAPTPTASAAPSPLLPPLSSASATEQFFDYPPEVALREGADDATVAPTSTA
ncbi:uncharacterized protein RHTO_06250 [Rhodotorula toruloides NP11]|uniref:Proteophosphoglycan ppg4 n=1 Tax=Rhodotorula toruloides (strain NP11) TaxID=1130832 RepID=M7X1S8_RHOT1|nr:uncharacterized protein RHTO_06250 [Rhodotorula toruloides NP11]EMS24246.1 hypothetical protein RHTO_06250 [Rhodotorula toruloides NP11]